MLSRLILLVLFIHLKGDGAISQDNKLEKYLDALEGIIAFKHFQKYRDLFSLHSDRACTAPPPESTRRSSAVAVSVDNAVPTANTNKKPRKSDYQSCGFTAVRHVKSKGSSQFRVIRGDNAKPGGWPWMAAMGYRRNNSSNLEFRCGGSLISASHAITAAHCIHHDIKLSAVRLGIVRLTRETGFDVPVSKVIAHPQFNRQSAADDIAVVFLEFPVKFTALIHPICLPRGKMKKLSFENTEPYVAGWGVTENNKPSPWLKEVQLAVINNGKCESSYKKLNPKAPIPISHKQICCEKSGRDACQGDSGGGLMLSSGHHPRGEIYYLIGIVSMGAGCAKPNIPGVFTRVTSYLPWLKKVMGKLPVGPSYKGKKSTEKPRKLKIFRLRPKIPQMHHL